MSERGFAARGPVLGGADEDARDKLFEAVDQVRRRYGFGAVVVGAAGDLLGKLPHGRHGFRLRTPSLTK